MATETKKYTPGLGRRKTSVAQVRLVVEGSGKMTVNGRDWKVYFPVFTQQQKVQAPFEATGTKDRYDVSVKVSGGGLTGQADSVRMGIARALVELNPDYRAALKKMGFLTRDARKKERKKYGHKKARRSPQWSKR
jgi:small subunit ribosomal protein S9